MAPATAWLLVDAKSSWMRDKGCLSEGFGTAVTVTVTVVTADAPMKCAPQLMN